MDRIFQRLSLALVLMALTGCYGLGGGKAPPKPPPTAPPIERVTGRDYLVASEPEKKGYGLYSYLLFGSHPTEATRERYLRAVTAYLTIPPIGELEGPIPPQQLNITYLLLKDRPPRKYAECLQSQCVTNKRAVAVWVLNHYDYDRAQVLLGAVPGLQRNGPYIVSHFNPLTGIGTLSGQYLYQNLSWVPEDLVLSWVKEFLKQAAQEHFWEERTAQQLVLKLRTAIEILAKGLPVVQGGLHKWIAWR